MNKLQQNAKLGFLVFACLAWMTYGATANNWKADSNGNWNGKYSEVEHWSLGHLPSASEDCVFPPQTDVAYTVQVDGDRVDEFNELRVYNAVSSAPFQPVTFTGVGTLKGLSGQVRLWSGTAILAGNVTFQGSGDQTAGANCTLTVRDAAAYDLGTGCFVYGNGTKVLVEGGCFAAGLKGLTSEGIAFRMSGGQWVNANTTAKLVAANATADISISGGTVQMSTQIEDMRFLPRGAAVVTNTLASGNVVYVASMTVNEVSGTLHAWSDPSANGSAIRLTAPVCWYGRGRLLSNWFMTYAAGDFFFDLERIDVGRLSYPLTSATVEHVGDVTYGGFGDWTWQANPKANRFHGRLTLDTTDCIDAATSRTIPFPVADPQIGSSIRTIGSGTARLGLTYAVNTAYEGPDSLRVRQLDVSADLVAGVSGFGTAKVTDAALRCVDFNLSAGKKLTVYPGRFYIDCVNDPFIGDGAEILVDVTGLTAQDGTAGNQGLLVYPVFVCTKGEGVPLEKFRLVNNGGTTWQLKKTGGCVYLRDATEKRLNPSSYLWTGAKNGDWSDGENWQGGVAPGETDIAYFDVCAGETTVVIPEGGVTVKSISGGGLSSAAWYRSCGAFVFKGGPITLKSTSADNWDSAIYNSGMLPFYFECDVSIAGHFGPTSYKGVVFKGKVSSSQYLKPSGDIRVADALTCYSLYPVARHLEAARQTSLTVLSGGSVTISDQQAFPSSAQVSLNVLGGGLVDFKAGKAIRVFGFAGSANGTSVNPCVHLIDGRVKFADTIALTATADQHVAGTGRVDVALTQSPAAGVSRFVLKDGLTWAPKKWETVTSGNEGGALALGVAPRCTAILAPRADLEYGPAAGVTPTMEAAVRACELGIGAKLVVSCSDPDDEAVARDVTFVDPIAAKQMAMIQKEGTGTLTLASADNLFMDKAGVDVREGTLVWTKPQVVGTFAAAFGSTLKYGSSAGVVATLTINDNVDLTGVNLVADGAETTDLLARAQPVVIVSSGNHITGLPSVPDSIRVSVVPTADGGEQLRCKQVRGLAIIFR